MLDMTTRHLRLASLLLAACIAAGGCASRPVRSEKGSAGEAVSMRTDKPILRLYDRWGENESDQVLINGKDVVEAYPDGSSLLYGRPMLVTLLSEDPSPEVAAKLDSFRFWRATSQVAFATAAASTLLAVLGYTKGRGGDRLLALPVINTLWAVSGVSLGTLVYGVSSQSRSLDEALSIHNANSSRAPSVSLGVEVPIP
jgi:hypothetical protein